MVTIKQKKIIKAVILSLFLAIMLAGISIGVYFIVNDPSSPFLSRMQRAFGEAINLGSKKPDIKELDINALPSNFNKNNVVYYSDNLVVSYSQDVGYEVYSLDKKAYIDLALFPEFQEIAGVVGNIILAKDGTEFKILDAINNLLLCNESGANILYKEGYLLVKAQSTVKFEYFDNSSLDSSVRAFIVDVSSAEVILTADNDIIDISMFNGYASVVSADSTVIYRLNDMSKVLELANQGQLSFTSNISSSLNTNTYLLTEYNRVFALNEHKFLVEKTTSVNSSSDYDIKSALNNSDTLYYKINYYIFDALSNKTIELGGDVYKNKIIKAIDAGFGNDYIALVFADIIDKQTISDSNQKIAYYECKTSKNELNLSKIVEYEYSSKGEIVGFTGSFLVLSGAENSNVISFASKDNGQVETIKNEKVIQDNYDGTIVISSAFGLKTLKVPTKNNRTLGLFSKVSPFVQKNAIVVNEQGQYMHYNSGIDVGHMQVTLIDNFASEFEDYVFAGIGLYFTVAGSDRYNVYNFENKRLYANAKVEITKDKFLNTVLIEIDDGTLHLFKVKPVLDISSIGIDVKDFKNQSVKNIQPESEDILKPSSTVSQSANIAISNYELSFNVADLANQFVPLNNITGELRVLIPQISNYQDDNGDVFTAVSAYFAHGDNFTVCITKLANINDANSFSYLVTLAFKNVYVNSLNATGNFGGNSHNLVMFNPVKCDATISKVVAAASLNGLYGMYNSSEAIDSIDYALAGFDGGLVFASDKALALSINFALQNAYTESGISSEFIRLSTMQNSQSVDCGKFFITMYENNNDKIFEFTTKKGYLLTAFNFVYGKASTSIYDNAIEEASEGKLSVAGINSKSYVVPYDDLLGYDYFKFKDISLIEEYFTINIQNPYEEGGIYKSYTGFFGYGEDVTDVRNPSILGFDNFASLNSLEVLEKVGYNFIGYTLNIDGVEQLVFDNRGNFISSAQEHVNKMTAGNTYLLVPKYEAKKYNIFFETSNNGGRPIPSETLTVTYGEKVGPLFVIDENSQYALAGHNFVGWFNSKGEQFTQDTVYLVDGNTTLGARFEPKMYQITLDLNLDVYQNANILGFDYKITNLMLSNSYAGFEANLDITNMVLTKEVTFGQAFNELPSIYGLNMSNTAREEKYDLVGWFDQKNIEERDNNVNRGQAYTQSTIASTDVPLTLYAHYVRPIYNIKVDVLGNNDVVSSGSNVPLVSSLEYHGTTNYGRLADFSTAPKDGYNLWQVNDDNNGLNLDMYALRTQNAFLNVFVNEGYYVSGLQIKVYLKNGQTAVYNYLSNGNTQDDVLQIVKNGNDLTINFVDLSDAYFTDNEYKYAELTINVDAIKFTNHVSVSNDSSCAQVYASDKLVNSPYEHSVAFGNLTVYKFMPILNANRDNLLIADYVLSQINIDGEILTFDVSYQLNGDSYAHVLASSSPAIATTETIDGKKVTKSVYTISEDIELIIVNEEGSNTFVAYVNVYSYKDHSISATFEKVSADVSINISNSSKEAGSENGINAVGMKYTSNQSAGVASLGGNMNASDTFVFDFNLASEKYFINSLSIVYGGRSFNVAVPNINISSTELGIYQESNFVATSEAFISSTNSRQLKNTSIKIVWNEQTRTFSVSVSNVLESLAININYSSYSLLEIDSPSVDAYKVYAVSDTQAEVTLDDLILNNASNVFVQGNNNKKRVLVVNLEKTAKYLKVKSLLTNEVTYFVESAISYPNNQIIINSKLTEAVVETYSEHLSSVKLKEVSSSLSISSYLGVAGEYQSDVNIITKLSATFKNLSGNNQTIWLSDTNSFEFVGNNVVIKIYVVKGYELGRVTLLGGAGSILPNNEDYATIKSDANGSYYEYSFAISDLSQTAYSLSVYSDAIKYIINYDGVGATSGSTASSMHYYNVNKALTNNGFIKSGYSFIGWSKEQKTGADLTIADVDFVDNAVLTENLSETNDEQITLYAVWQANTYMLNYDYNDARVSNGSSLAENLIEGESSVQFDHVFGKVATLTRPGYTFVGFYSSRQGGSMISQGDMLDNSLFNSLTVAGSVITLYARYTANTYNVIVNKNDATSVNGFGSSICETDIGVVSITFDDEQTLPVLSRLGYNFMGYKSVQLNSDEAKTNRLAYIFLPNKSSALTYEFINPDNNYNLQIDEKTKTITLFAVWQAKSYKVYINLNNRDLATYGKEDGVFRVTHNGNTISTSTDYILYTFNVEFDKPFVNVPIVYPVGYTFNGMYFTKDFSLDNDDKTGVITNNTRLDNSVYNSLTYTSSDNKTTPLTASSTQFSIYAHYTSKTYTLLNQSDDRAHMSLSNINDYDYSNVSSGSLENLIFGYNSDLVFDYLTETGKYVSKIGISFADNNGAREQLEITFRWLSYTKTLSVLVNNEVIGKVDDIYTILGEKLYVCSGIYVKLLPYNEGGLDLSNSVFDAVRVIVGIDGAKTDMDISVETKTQTYVVNYYRYLKDGYQSIVNDLPRDFIQSITFNYGDQITSENTSSIYTKYFALKAWYYGKINTDNRPENPETTNYGMLTEGDIIKENKVVVGLYELSRVQAVNFYMWDILQNKYVLRENTSENYVLCYYDEQSNSWTVESNSYFDINTGKAIKLPSNSSEIWPTRTDFGGYIIASSDQAVDGKYFSWTSGANTIDASAFELFSTDTVIERELSVYAVYYEPKFDIELKIEGADIVAKADIEIYRQLSSGDITKYDNSSVKVVRLTEEQMRVYQNAMNLDFNTKEVALGLALEHDLSNAVSLGSSGFTAVDAVTNQTYYYFAFVTMVKDGQEYIYQVADNYYKLENNTLVTENG